MRAGHIHAARTLDLQYESTYLQALLILRCSGSKLGFPRCFEPLELAAAQIRPVCPAAGAVSALSGGVHSIFRIGGKQGSAASCNRLMRWCSSTSACSLTECMLTITGERRDQLIQPHTHMMTRGGSFCLAMTAYVLICHPFADLFTRVHLQPLLMRVQPLLRRWPSGTSSSSTHSSSARDTLATRAWSHHSCSLLCLNACRGRLSLRAAAQQQMASGPSHEQQQQVASSHSSEGHVSHSSSCSCAHCCLCLHATCLCSDRSHCCCCHLLLAPR